MEEMKGEEYEIGSCQSKMRRAQGTNSMLEKYGTQQKRERSPNFQYKCKGQNTLLMLSSKSLRSILRIYWPNTVVK